MLGMRQYRKRVELILMVFIGLAWGILLSELMPRTRWHRALRNNQGIDGSATSLIFPSSGRSSLYSSSPPSSLPTATPIITTDASATRVLCLVLTSPKTHQSRAVHIQRTWGTRCHKLIFMSTKEDKELGAVALNVREGYSNLWGKTRASLQYVYQHHFRNYDWFLKADDDTYVVMENLRAFLYAHSPKSPVYFGSKIGRHVKQGGGEYVLSKAALHKFMKSAFDNSSICSNLNIGYEDVELRRCLESVGVVAGDSRDEQGLSRFIPFSPLHWSKDQFNYTTLNFTYSTQDTSDCCSNSAISFHSTNAKEFYVLDYIIYKLKS
ncbi:hypothetical protein KR054_003730 [Drosophila jambulina]|nr:hypothetical protein KR054_003730 [Drosophila jambulina]